MTSPQWRLRTAAPFAEEQAALRRVAALVAGAAAPEAVFAAVTEEVGRVLGVDLTAMSRYDPDGAVTILGTWTRTGAPVRVPHGGRVELGGQNVTTLVFQTGQPARIDNYAEASGPSADAARYWGIHSFVGVPISVDDRIWGVMFAASTRDAALPADAEGRLAGFTELVATAVANAQARVELRGFADGQDALRRVATLIARATPPQEVFAAVAAEVGRLLGCDFTLMNRYDPDGMVTVVGAWSTDGLQLPLPVGSRRTIDGRNATTLVFNTGRPARIDYCGADSGQGPAAFVAAGMRTSVGAPITVEGQLWGVMIAISRAEPLPADTETRLAGFTDLAGTAVAKAEAHAALTTSRTRIVTTADATRRRIERDLHDGAQQRLVSLALQLRAAHAALPADAGELAAQLDDIAKGLGEALDELREIARGIHPTTLTAGGLPRALKTLARRSAVAVDLHVRVDQRPPDPIELAAYYIVAEALTNTAKHAQASTVEVNVEARGGVLHIRIRDDGRGGADLTGGTGLVGLKDRIEVLGGTISLHSPPGAGTTVDVTLPLDDHRTTRPPR